ncbi:MAG: chemotaxis protein CheC [Firmicutes bacterium]|jgi:chemotaxis protein CheY-P-specific phosphatase CheC|nr:chemotaxis protein CheC [Bacillota bacterium]MDH7496660.1 chemotaxis protein CheC [Bacillota bacterium]
MESAASVLSDMIGRKIAMSVPDVCLVAREDISRVAKHSVEEPTVGVRIGLTGDVTGDVILIFPRPSAFRLVDILMGNAPGTTTHLTEIGGSALCEVGNLAGSFFLNSLAEATGLRAMPAPPVLDGETLVSRMLEASVATREGQISNETRKGKRDGTHDEVGKGPGHVTSGDALVAQTVLTQSLESVEALFFIMPTNDSLATILDALSSGNAKGNGVM